MTYRDAMAQLARLELDFERLIDEANALVPAIQNLRPVKQEIYERETQA